MCRLSIFLSLLCLTLTACQSIQSTEPDHRAFCSELKHQIIFSGSTTSESKAWQERMDGPKLAESYHNAGC